MNQAVSSSTQKVQQALRELGLECRAVDMPASTRTAKEAAQAIGCTLEQMVK